MPLERIHVPENVRALNAEHVDALAASIALQGMLVPIVVCPAQSDVATGGFEYELVAGFHRVAAAGKLGLAEVPAVIRDSAGEEADRAVENIARLQLGPAEEAAAVKAMLDKGLTEDGAGRALGWPKARVTARVKLLELPEKARELVGAGVIPLSAVDQLRTIGTVSSQLLEVLVEYLDSDRDGHTWTAEPARLRPWLRAWERAARERQQGVRRLPAAAPSARSTSCGSARRRPSRSPRPRSSTARSTSTPTARRRSASVSRMSTRHAPLAS